MYGEAHEASHQRACHVGRADAEGEAAERAAVRRVRVGADDQLPRCRVLLRHHGVADTLGALARRQQAVVAKSMHASKVLVGLRQIAYERQVPLFHVGLATMREAEVILEEEDGRRVVQLHWLAE